MIFMKNIEQAYPQFTPQHKDCGSFDNLHVYTMNNIGGVSMYLARDCCTGITTSFCEILSTVTQGLPDRFHSTLDRLIPELPSIFDKSWPMVPNHTDLLENNIHVDPDTGTILGICDWRDAEVSPFGMSLGGLETMIGVMTMNEYGWSYFPSHNELREQFWTTFYQCLGVTSEAQRRCIEVARLTRLFLANGFMQDEDGTWIRLPTRA
ncbi:hypothetical protein BX600DRAFT_500741 [Xylariales sp. PMI_506]|nr:hypothetical protein BX600DRAFT_500741 [Xylariales sp. PMI_506]